METDISGDLVVDACRSNRGFATCQMGSDDMSRMHALYVQSSFIARMLALPSLRLSLRTSYSEDQECL
jgi:hypothetical protein